MVHTLDKLKIKHLESIIDGNKTTYTGGLFAGYAELGLVTTDLNDLMQLDLVDSTESELRQELARRATTESVTSLEQYIKDLVAAEVEEQKVYELLEVPRDYLRDFVKENPDDKYNSFAILYIKKNGRGTISLFKSEKSTQDDSIDKVIKQVGLNNKVAKQAVTILGFHYVSLRKIVTTEIL